MARKNKSILILFSLVVLLALVTTLFACNKKGPTTDDIGPSYEEPPELNERVVFRSIKESLDNQSNLVSKQTVGIRQVNSEFNFIAGGVNLTLIYKAMYDVERAEDSEIMLKIDNQKESTTPLFLYYHNKDLYLYLAKNIVLEDKFVLSGQEHLHKQVIRGFASNKLFPMFYNLMQSIDMQSFLFTEDFTKQVEELYKSVELKNIKQFPLDDEGTVTTRVQNVDLDKFNKIVNAYILENITVFGSRFDALTKALLGFKLSALGSVQIARLTLDELNVIERPMGDGSKKYIDHIGILFKDKQADNITDYSIGLNYDVNIIEETNKRSFSDEEIGALSPNKIDYTHSDISNLHLKGYADIYNDKQIVEEVWDVELKANLSGTEDENFSRNKLSFEVVSKSSALNENDEGYFSYDIINAWVKNGSLYVDVEGLLEKYIGESIDYQKTNLPKILMDNFILADKINTYYFKLFAFVDSFTLGKMFSQEEDNQEEDEALSTLRNLLPFVRSENNRLFIRINKDFAQVFSGEDKNTLSWIGEELELDKNLIEVLEMINLGENLEIELSYDFAVRNIQIKILNGSKIMAFVSLDVMDVEEDLLIEFPDEEDLIEYKAINIPDVQVIDFTLRLGHQEKEGLDVSPFVGVFMGDVSGMNTPVTLANGEDLILEGLVWEKDENLYIAIDVYVRKINAQKQEVKNLLYRLCSDTTTEHDVMIQDFMHDIKFKMSMMELLSLYKEMLKVNTDIDFKGLMSEISKANMYGNAFLDLDKIRIELQNKSTLLDNINDILFKYTGLKGLNGTFSFKGSFDEPSTEFLKSFMVQGNPEYENSTFEEIASSFFVPTVSFENPQPYFDNIYEVRFAANVLIDLNGEIHNLSAGYIPSSIAYAPNKYFYTPTVRLFGKENSYRVNILDRENGTREILRLDKENIEIDPSLENPIPEKIGVIYKDSYEGNIRGNISYSLGLDEGFGYTNDNIMSAVAGVARKEYNLVIGKSELEGVSLVKSQSFRIYVTILPRAIKPLNNMFYNAVPIVAQTTIDPIEYALKIKNMGAYDPVNNPQGYNPLKYTNKHMGYNDTDLIIEFFQDVNDPSNHNTEKVVHSNPNWEFSFSEIRYDGMKKVVFGKYNMLDIAMEVDILDKTISHIQINDEISSYYTIDALRESTFKIPTYSDLNLNNTIRLYFNSGYYRIVGEDLGVEIDDYFFDGYFDEQLVWSIPRADFVQLDGTLVPLMNGTANKTLTEFGFDSIGWQTIELNVACPTRIPQLAPEFVNAIFSIEYEPGSTAIKENAVLEEAIKPHMVSFWEDGELASPFELDPYDPSESNLKLPNEVYMDVLYAGGILKRVKYPITWLTSRPNSPSVERNVIDESGNIKNILINEKYLEVNGVLGDRHKTFVKMLIHNLGADYLGVQFYDAEQEEYTYYNDVYPLDGTQVEVDEGPNGMQTYSLVELNPYSTLVLPSYVKLEFKDGYKAIFYAISWEAGGLPVEEYLNDYLSPSGGDVLLVGKIGGDGIVSQVVYLTLSYNKKIVKPYEIFNIVSTLTPEHSSSSGIGERFENIDIYSPESKSVLERFEESSTLDVGVRFDDGTVVLNIESFFENSDDFITVLKSPMGSSLCEDGVFELIGYIKQGTSLQQKISLRFKVGSKIIAQINFPRIKEDYFVEEGGVSAIEVEQSNSYLDTNGVLVGDNELTVKINKPFFVKIETGGFESSVSLSEYIDYIFERLNLSFGSVAANMKAHLDIPSFDEINLNFDEVAYVKYPHLIHPALSYENNNQRVVISMQIKKFGEGSCEEPYDFKLIIEKDELSTNARQKDEFVEIFYVDGTTMYGGEQGYIIPEDYYIQFPKSGAVKFSDLEWRANARLVATIEEIDENGQINYVEVASIDKDAIVEFIPNVFFQFEVSNVRISLKAILPDGTAFIRHLLFVGKKIDKVLYDIVDTEYGGKYNIKSNLNNPDESGILNISNIYNYALDEIADQLPRVIKPLRTQLPGQNVSFEIEGDWIPAAEFAKEDNPQEFDVEKIIARLSSANGTPKLLFAKAKIRGYNRAEQEIFMYIRVYKLDEGAVSHDNFKFTFSNGSNYLAFDPYEDPENQGVLELPKDIKINFKNEVGANVSYKFSVDDSVVYKIKRQNSNDYDEIESISYNKLGHTLSSIYGSPTDTLILKIVLPDGNESTQIRIQFLNRKLIKTKFENKKTKDNSVSEFLENTYYIDPYDYSTYTLPEFAYFTFGTVGEGNIYEDVKTIIELEFSSEDPFVRDSEDRVVYSPEQNAHLGAHYILYGFLKGFGEGDSRQFFFLNVFVLNRSINQANKPSYLIPSAGLEVAEYRLDGNTNNRNPIEFLAKDIPSDFEASNLYNLEANNPDFSVVSQIELLIQDLENQEGNEGATFNYLGEYLGGKYALYNQIATPVNMKIKWFREVLASLTEVEDHDITHQGFTYSLTGRVAYGVGESYVYSEIVEMKLIADKWEFKEIEGLSEGNYVIDFSPYTKKSIEKEFTVKFLVKGQEKSIVFTAESEIIEATRAAIYWGDLENVNFDAMEKHSLLLRNPYKTSTANSIETQGVYSYIFKQIEVDQISFGFGENNGYAGSGEAAYIVDPLNIIIPNKVLAKGKMNPSDEQFVDIGEVNIQWESGFWNYSNVPMNSNDLGVNGEEYYKETTVYLSVENQDQPIPFDVRVYYIHRRPDSIATNDKPVSYNKDGAPQGGYATLMSYFAGNQIWNFKIDPTDVSVYVLSEDPKINAKYYEEIFLSGSDSSSRLQNSYYILPRTLRVRFLTQDSFVHQYGGAVYGESFEVTLVDIEWLISREIGLEGTTESTLISAQIRAFKVEYQRKNAEGVEETVVSSKKDFGMGKEDVVLLKKFYTLNLHVVNKKVESTSISTEETVTPPGSTVSYPFQKVEDEYAIDPYNISFPNNVTVYFANDSKEYKDITWQYNLNYLLDKNVISGSIGEDFMYIYASFRVFGTNLHMKFKIKPRVIDDLEDVGGGQTSVKQLNGGVLYLVKDVPLKDQLPTHLYYKFEVGTDIEIVKVPLSFSDNTLNQIDIDQVREYNGIVGRLGLVNDNNISFTFKFIDPAFYEVSSYVDDFGKTVFYNTNVKYNELSIAVTKNGSYTPSMETTALPTKLMLTSEVLGGDYADITSIKYVLESGVAPYAIIEAKYVFKTLDSDVRLFGADSEIAYEQDKQTLRITVPLNTYQHNSIEGSTLVFERNSHTVELGDKINITDLPLVQYSANKWVRPLWILTDVNTNRAGTYKATAYIKNAYGTVIEADIDIIVNKYTLVYKSGEGTQKDVTISDDFLIRTYSGVAISDVKSYITISNMLRENGEHGSLNNYVVEYSIDGGQNWQMQQPIQANIGNATYQVRVRVRAEDDYNVTGSIAFHLNIRPLAVEGSELYFEKDGARIDSGQVTYTYNSLGQYPAVKGMHNEVEYIREFRAKEGDTFTTWSTSLVPVNVGEYEMRIQITPNQSNFDLKIREEDLDRMIIKIDIVKPNRNYAVTPFMTYNGEFRHVIVEDLPDNLSGMSVTYEYFQERDGGYVALPPKSLIRDAGFYKVNVIIDGGINYPSMELVDRPFQIVKKQIIININTVTSRYLDDIKDFASQVTITSPNSDEVITGNAALNILNENLNSGSEGEKYKIVSEGGRLTNRHTIGSYNLSFDLLAIPFEFKNYELFGVGVTDGVYKIEIDDGDVISNWAMLQSNIAALQDGHTVKWYLMPGVYGGEQGVTLNKNASVTIVGAYSLDSDIEDALSVFFTSIVIRKGSLNLSLAQIYRRDNGASIAIYGDVSGTPGTTSVSLSKVYMAAIEDTPGETAERVINSKAIFTEYNFKGDLYIFDSIIKNYEKGIELNGGNIYVENTLMQNNGVACTIAVDDTNVSFVRAEFINNHTGLKFASTRSYISLQENVFSFNYKALIKGLITLRVDVTYQNTFSVNAYDIY